MASGIVLGMNYLHTAKRPVIHADLKMKNVLVSDGYKPKVLLSDLKYPESQHLCLRWSQNIFTRATLC